MGANGSTESETWPPGWEDIPEEPRRIARNTILEISAMTPTDFLAIGSEPYAIPADEWSFDAYTTAATAAVQEDIKLNKIIYRLVPRQISEEEFWRLYFSKVLYVLDSVKKHGVYPPPAPPPPPPPPPPAQTETASPAASKKTSILLSNPGQMEETCLLM